MEDLWRIEDLAYRLPDLADPAEYRRMLRRYRTEEGGEQRRPPRPQAERSASTGP